VWAWRWTAPASPWKTATAADGLYFVRYVAPNADKKEPGFFGKLFGGSSAAVPPLKYRIVVRSEGKPPPCPCSTKLAPPSRPPTQSALFA
jgi:hypothetical protein